MSYTRNQADINKWFSQQYRGRHPRSETGGPRPTSVPRVLRLLFFIFGVAPVDIFFFFERRNALLYTHPVQIDEPVRETAPVFAFSEFIYPRRSMIACPSSLSLPLCARLLSRGRPSRGIRNACGHRWGCRQPSAAAAVFLEMLQKANAAHLSTAAWMCAATATACRATIFFVARL
jgi:hypothetical protein